MSGAASRQAGSRQAGGGRAGVLAQLIAQGEGAGADLATLRAIAEEAGELGATRALTRLGLADDGAGGDVRELRDLLRMWRDAKASAWRAGWAWVVRVVGAALLAWVAVRLGFGDGR